MKSQDTIAACEALDACAPPDIAVACFQNGVENERVVLRHFAGTYAVCVMSPTSHIEPGVVIAQSAPVSGLLDIGCYPTRPRRSGRTRSPPRSTRRRSTRSPRPT